MEGLGWCPLHAPGTHSEERPGQCKGSCRALSLALQTQIILSERSRFPALASHHRTDARTCEKVHPRMVITSYMRGRRCQKSKDQKKNMSLIAEVVKPSRYSGTISIFLSPL
ncbi:hypothetical protein MC885_015326, partial [Smutsia gigantea]